MSLTISRPPQPMRVSYPKEFVDWLQLRTEQKYRIWFVCGCEVTAKVFHGYTELNLYFDTNGATETILCDPIPDLENRTVQALQNLWMKYKARHKNKDPKNDYVLQLD